MPVGPVLLNLANCPQDPFHIVSTADFVLLLLASRRRSCARTDQNLTPNNAPDNHPRQKKITNVLQIWNLYVFRMFSGDFLSTQRRFHTVSFQNHFSNQLCPPHLENSTITAEHQGYDQVLSHTTLLVLLSLTAGFTYFSPSLKSHKCDLVNMRRSALWRRKKRHTSYIQILYGCKICLIRLKRCRVTEWRMYHEKFHARAYVIPFTGTTCKAAILVTTKCCNLPPCQESCLSKIKEYV